MADVGIALKFKNHRRKWIIIAMIAITSICIAIALAILLPITTESDDVNSAGLLPLSLSDVVDGSLYPSFKQVDFFGSTSSGFQWLSSHELLYQSDTSQSVILYDLQKKDKAVLVDHGIIDKTDSYAVSPSRQYLLYSQNTKNVFRYMYSANFRLLSLEKENGLSESWDVLPATMTDPVKLQLAKWASTEDSLIMVYKNDIYYKKAPNSEAVRITDTGSTDEKPNVIYNGVPDWLYQEEILKSDSAIWWSPDNKFLAFLSFDDSKVDAHFINKYGGDDLLYPFVDMQKICYPQAGRPNPSVRLFIVNPEEVARTNSIPGDDALVHPPSDLNFEDYYITTVSWLTDDELFVRWTNRYQNESGITICSPTTLQCTLVVNLKVSNGWLEDAAQSPMNSGQNFQILSGNFTTTDRHYQTVCTYSTTTKAVNNLGKCLDHNFDVAELIAVDPNDAQAIYVLAAYPLPRYRHILKLRGESVTCLTCNNTIKCNYFDDVKFSSSLEYMTFTCLGPNVPYSAIWKLSDYIMSSDTVELLRSNKNIQAIVDQKVLPQRKYYELPLSSMKNGPNAQIELLLPPNLVESAQQQYALLVKIYAGPGTQEVHSRYRMEFEEVLASAHDIVIARMDVRGSSMQGYNMKYALYKEFGRLEVLDHLEIIKSFILTNHTYIDPKRVGIWGHSYGGFAAARTVLMDDVLKPVIQCAASVAPVSDWRFEYSAYTERYLSTPQDNPKGYERNLLGGDQDLVLHFSDVSFLLMQGVADDNVLFHQAMQFVKALRKAGVLFRIQLYPEEGHGLKNVRLHFYQTLLEHFTTCFDKAVNKQLN